MAKSESTLRVVKKSKAEAEGHHGGSWKVAYADFVTAMMAFFLVMWIIGLNESARQSIAAYFKDPAGFMKSVQAGENPFTVGKGLGKSIMKPIKPPPRGRMDQEKLFRKTKEILENEMRSAADLKGIEKYVKVSVSNEGLRIDVVDASKTMFFDSGSAEIKPEYRKLLALIANEIAKLPNRVVIEGHTDNQPYHDKPNYTNWELSADRANAARRILETNGLKHWQIARVDGYADTMPMNRQDPTHYTNRRVSIVVAYDESSEDQTPNATSAKPVVH